MGLSVRSEARDVVLFSGTGAVLSTLALGVAADGTTARGVSGFSVAAEARGVDGEARERVDRVEFDSSEITQPGQMSSTGTGLNSETSSVPGPSTSGSPATNTAQPNSPPPSSSTPVFGQVKEPIKKKAVKKVVPAKDVSAEVAHKLTNATAMRSLGMQKSKYSWMTGAAVGPSPLGKKKKRENEVATSDLGGNDGDGKEEVAALVPAVKPRIPVFSAPARRHVVVYEDGMEKTTMGDDKALTLLDVVWAMGQEKGTQKGYGSTEDIIRKIYSKPGGPYGNT